MAPLTFPPSTVERFLISGRGSLVLTEAQRGARALTITVEKVRPAPAVGTPAQIPAYFNNRYPEPQGHWGYLQLLRRDWVESERQLQYRRELVYSGDFWEAEQLAQVSCHLQRLSKVMFAGFSRVMDLCAAPNLPAILLTGMDDVRTEYELKTKSVPTPLHPLTSLWYSIEYGWRAQVTISHTSYLPLDCGLDYQPSPPPPVPPKGGSQGSADEGERNAPPPPAGRITDPLSDLPSPPSGQTSGGPAVPQQSPPLPTSGNTEVRWDYTTGSQARPTDPCNVTTVTDFAYLATGIHPSSAFTVESTAPPDSRPGYACNYTGYTVSLYFQPPGGGARQLLGSRFVVSPAFPRVKIRYLVP